MFGCFRQGKRQEARGKSEVTNTQVLCAVAEAQAAMNRPSYCVPMPKELIPPGPVENTDVVRGVGFSFFGDVIDQLGYSYSEKHRLRRFFGVTADERDNANKWFNNGLTADEIVAG